MAKIWLEYDVAMELINACWIRLKNLFWKILVYLVYITAYKPPQNFVTYNSNHLLMILWSKKLRGSYLGSSLLFVPEVTCVPDGWTEAGWSKMASLTFLADDAGCWLSPWPGWFISSPHSLFPKLLDQTSSCDGGSIPKGQDQKLQTSWNWGWQGAQCQFWHIQLAKTSYRASSDSGRGRRPYNLMDGIAKTL